MVLSIFQLLVCLLILNLYLTYGRTTHHSPLDGGRHCVRAGVYSRAGVYIMAGVYSMPGVYSRAGVYSNMISV